MKFNRCIQPDLRDLLENEYKEYIRKTPMTQKEQRALREWVKSGHSVYENSYGAWHDGQVPVEFLAIYRDEEYICQQTKGMNDEDTRKFAMEYYGWDDTEDEVPSVAIDANLFDVMPADLELPF